MPRHPAVIVHLSPRCAPLQAQQLQEELCIVELAIANAKMKLQTNSESRHFLAQRLGPTESGSPRGTGASCVGAVSSCHAISPVAADGAVRSDEDQSQTVSLLAVLLSRDRVV